METMETRRSVPEPGDLDERSDLRVVMQFFIVPLALVAVLVLVFFGLQILRSRRPDPAATLRSLRHYDGFLGGLVGDLKRWQYGYDFSLLLRGKLGEIDAALVPDLIAAFEEAGAGGDLQLRRYAVLALGQSADRRAVVPLRGALADADPPSRLFACWGLMRCGGAEALVALRGAVADPDEGVRKMAVFALGALGDRGSTALLRTALGDAAPDVGWNAALSLARLGDRAAVPVLLAMLHHPVVSAAGVTLQSGAVAAPATAGPTVPAGGDRAIVLNAIRGLALLRPPEARAALERIAGQPDGDAEFAAAARLALEAWSGEMAGPADAGGGSSDDIR
jgi:hypothetical protein